jgi:hypothetical protein
MARRWFQPATLVLIAALVALSQCAALCAISACAASDSTHMQCHHDSDKSSQPCQHQHSQMFAPASSVAEAKPAVTSIFAPMPPFLVVMSKTGIQQMWIDETFESLIGSQHHTRSVLAFLSTFRI